MRRFWDWLTKHRAHMSWREFRSLQRGLADARAGRMRRLDMTGDVDADRLAIYDVAYIGCRQCDSTTFRHDGEVARCSNGHLVETPLRREDRNDD